MLETSTDNTTTSSKLFQLEGTLKQLRYCLIRFFSIVIFIKLSWNLIKVFVFGRLRGQGNVFGRSDDPPSVHENQLPKYFRSPQRKPRVQTNDHFVYLSTRNNFEVRPGSVWGLLRHVRLHAFELHNQRKIYRRSCGDFTWTQNPFRLEPNQSVSRYFLQSQIKQRNPQKRFVLWLVMGRSDRNRRRKRTRKVPIQPQQELLVHLRSRGHLEVPFEQQLDEHHQVKRR